MFLNGKFGLANGSTVRYVPIVAWLVLVEGHGDENGEYQIREVLYAVSILACRYLFFFS